MNNYGTFAEIPEINNESLLISNEYIQNDEHVEQYGSSQMKQQEMMNSPPDIYSEDLKENVFQQPFDNDPKDTFEVGPKTVGASTPVNMFSPAAMNSSDYNQQETPDMRRKPSEPRREIIGIYIQQNNALQQQEATPSE